MDKWVYVMTIVKGKMYNKLTKDIISKHVDNLKELDEAGKLFFCGVYKKYPGVAGMVVLKTQSYEEAQELCKKEPLVAMGYATFQLHALQVADKENNYLF